jgi:hypothetical protein
MRQSERPAAEHRVFDQPARAYVAGFEVDATLHVPELPHVEVVTLAVGPAEEDVRRSLDEPLSLQHAASLVVDARALDVGGQHRLPRLLELKEERIRRAGAFEEGDPAPCPHTPHAHHLSGNVHEPILRDARPRS